MVAPVRSYFADGGREQFYALRREIADRWRVVYGDPPLGPRPSAEAYAGPRELLPFLQVTREWLDRDDQDRTRAFHRAVGDWAASGPDFAVDVRPKLFEAFRSAIDVYGSIARDGRSHLTDYLWSQAALRGDEIDIWLATGDVLRLSPRECLLFILLSVERLMPFSESGEASHNLAERLGPFVAHLWGVLDGVPVHRDWEQRLEAVLPPEIDADETGDPLAPVFAIEAAFAYAVEPDAEPIYRVIRACRDMVDHLEGRLREDERDTDAQVIASPLALDQVAWERSTIAALKSGIEAKPALIARARAWDLSSASS
jgi:hypothetical protein